MNYQKIKLKKIVEGEKTYPSWTTGSEYELQTSEGQKSLKVFYKVSIGRKIGREFPKFIQLSSKFCYVLGLIKGEGANSLGKSNYRRFTLTNSDPNVIKLVLTELKNQNLVSNQFPERSFHILHFKKLKRQVVDYWSNELSIDKSKFKCFDDKNKTSDYGVCHIYLSDVLLRRITDLLQNFISQ